jgi:hypothetical protein
MYAKWVTIKFNYRPDFYCNKRNGMSGIIMTERPVVSSIEQFSEVPVSCAKEGRGQSNGWNEGWGGGGGREKNFIRN